MVGLADGRIDRDEWLLEMARVVSLRGTCSRLRVGAVFSRDGRVLTTGYNGAPAGLPHCEHEPLAPLGKGCTTAEHAERNGIAFAARHGVALEGCDMHVTHMPCPACSMSIINAGIEVVVFKHPYRDTSGVELMERVGIQVIDMSDGVG